MKYANRHFLIIHKAIWLQLILGLIAIILVGFWRYNANSVISAIIGVLLVMMPAIVSAKIAFWYGLFVRPKEALIQHQRAVLVRFFVSIILFILVFVLYKECDFLALFTAYLITFNGYWLSLIIKDI